MIILKYKFILCDIRGDHNQICFNIKVKQKYEKMFRNNVLKKKKTSECWKQSQFMIFPPRKVFIRITNAPKQIRMSEKVFVTVELCFQNTRFKSVITKKLLLCTNAELRNICRSIKITYGKVVVLI